MCFDKSVSKDSKGLYQLSFFLLLPIHRGSLYCILSYIDCELLFIILEEPWNKKFPISPIQTLRSFLFPQKLNPLHPILQCLHTPSSLSFSSPSECSPALQFHLMTKFVDSPPSVDDAQSTPTT